jgi:hypothetical protein
MHGAPAVICPVGRSRSRLVMILVFLALGCSVCAALVQGLEPGFVRVILAICVMVVAVVSLGAWWRSETEELQWDGRRWHLSRWPDATDLRLCVVLDLQFLMLIRVTTHDGKQGWLWIESQRSTPRWLATRRAIVAGQNNNGEKPASLET